VQYPRSSEEIIPESKKRSTMCHPLRMAHFHFGFSNMEVTADLDMGSFINS
jgi:hypothetical protein